MTQPRATSTQGLHIHAWQPVGLVEIRIPSGIGWEPGHDVVFACACTAVKSVPVLHRSDVAAAAAATARLDDEDGA